MEKDALHLLNRINQAIIQFRGSYAAWSAQQGISYHALLVLYTLREQGCCTQKQLCERYLLPKQTIHHVFARLRAQGLLVLDEGSGQGREKRFVLTQAGQQAAAPLLAALDRVESRALAQMGEEKLRLLTTLLLEYGSALRQAAEVAQ